MELHFIKVHVMLILLPKLHFCYYTVASMLVQVQFLFLKFFAVVVFVALTVISLFKNLFSILKLFSHSFTLCKSYLEAIFHLFYTYFIPILNLFLLFYCNNFLQCHFNPIIFQFCQARLFSPYFLFQNNRFKIVIT